MSTVIDNAKAAFTDINLMHLQDIVETICNHALERAYPPIPSRKSSNWKNCYMIQHL